jgi:hypothetical protein
VAVGLHHSSAHRCAVPFLLDLKTNSPLHRSVRPGALLPQLLPLTKLLVLPHGHGHHQLLDFLRRPLLEADYGQISPIDSFVPIEEGKDRAGGIHPYFSQ